MEQTEVWVVYFLLYSKQPLGVAESRGSSSLPGTHYADLVVTHRGMHRFVPRHKDEVAIEIGDPIHVARTDDDLWCEGVNLRTSQRGLFPSMYATDLAFLEEEEGKQSLSGEVFILSSFFYIEKEVRRDFLCVRAACGLQNHPCTGDALALYVHKRIKHGHNPPYLQTRAVYLQKRGPNLGFRTWCVLPPYGIGSTQTQCSMFSACRTFSAFDLHAGYGITPSTCDVRAMYVHVRLRAQRTASPSLC